MPVAKTSDERRPSGTTTFPDGGFWRAEGSETAVVAETSLGFIHTSRFKEAILLINVTAIGGTGPSFTVRVYQVDQKDVRIGTALVSPAASTVSTSRTVVTAPIGNHVEITKQLAGTTPTVTANIELQLKT